MNKENKPVIRVQMIANTRVQINPDLTSETYRVAGTDYWQVKVQVKTPEGQISLQYFTNTCKGSALKEAYQSLERATVNQWLPAIRKQILERCEDMLASDTCLMERFESSISALALGSISRENFLKAWDAQANLAQETGPKPFVVKYATTVDNHCETLPPKPKCWSFWDWFRKYP